ncbi:hypothetical protein WOLCODRAFT_162175 [Wolfiporia cocos MD-104 SS10]|uniref:Uncharacterized protein n=1 Tax=Wolfiporia cocos (strain MD-104) TaxID=742152 RepID=A0A2H3JK19_WOLCO|nr:hypothetical protein WOLCODRAFT_162175 [Wolfiporia cocos MD-104 SS10]
MGLIISGLQECRNKRKAAKANAAKRRTPEAASAPVREDYVEATEGGGEVRSDPSSALQEEAQNLGAVEQTTRENSAVNSGDVEGESAPRRESTLERAGEAQEVKNTEPWRHIGRVPGAPDPALTENDPSSRRPLQLPTEVYERVIDWLWGVGTKCSVTSLYTIRARSEDMRGERENSHISSSMRDRSGWRLPLVRHLVIQNAIWKPSDFHPLIFVHLSAFSSVTTLRLFIVTFPKVREFGRLVCALPSLVRLSCVNVLFTSTAPYASLAITRCPPSVRLTGLEIYSYSETSSDVEANRSLIEHLCAAGLVTDLQRFEFSAWASPDSKYLDAYGEPVQELLKQCSRSLRSLKLFPYLREGKDLPIDMISESIASVFNLTCCDSLETVALYAFNFEKLREVSIVICMPLHSQNAEGYLQQTVSALRKDICPHLNELLSNQDYEKLCRIDLVLCTDPDGVMPDAARWRSLLEAEMLKLHERRVLWTRVDVDLLLATHDASLTSAGRQSAMLLTNAIIGIRAAEHSPPSLPSARCLGSSIASAIGKPPLYGSYDDRGMSPIVPRLRIKGAPDGHARWGRI